MLLGAVMLSSTLQKGPTINQIATLRETLQYIKRSSVNKILQNENSQKTQYPIIERTRWNFIEYLNILRFYETFTAN